MLGALRGEDQRQQQNRAELADGAGGEQIGAEAGAQFTAVPENGNQRPNCGRRQSRAGVKQRQDNAGGGKHAADGVRDREDIPQPANPNRSGCPVMR